MVHITPGKMPEDMKITSGCGGSVCNSPDCTQHRELTEDERRAVIKRFGIREQTPVNAGVLRTTNETGTIVDLTISKDQIEILPPELRQQLNRISEIRKRILTEAPANKNKGLADLAFLVADSIVDCNQDKMDIASHFLNGLINALGMLEETQSIKIL